MTIWISRELPLFNFVRVYMWCSWIGHPCEKLWPIEFHESFRYLISSVLIYYKPESDPSVKCYDHLNFSRASIVQFRACRHIMRPTRTSVWKVRTIWISRELLLFYFERLDILCARIEHACEKLWPIEFLESFRYSISSVSIYSKPESYPSVKSYDHLNFSRAPVVDFQASLYVSRLNRTSVWKVVTIWISPELPLFNFERLDMWFARIGHLC